MRIRSFICTLWLMAGLAGQNGLLSAQMDTTVFAPLGATWYYAAASSGPPWVAAPLYASFAVEKDSFMLGYPARVIGCYVNVENQLIRVDSLTKYVATIGNSVYYKVGNEFVLLYDFGAKIGDTISSGVEDFGLSLGCGSDFSEGAFAFRYVIDSIATQDIDDETVRIQYVHSIYQFPGPNWVFENPVMERVGPLDFGSWWWGRGEGCIFESGFIRCYVDDEVSWRSSYFQGTTPCDYTSTEIADEPDAFKLYPNPAYGRVFIPLGAELNELFDVMGRRMSVEIEGDEIDISQLAAGVYFLRCELKGRLRILSFIKGR